MMQNGVTTKENDAKWIKNNENDAKMEFYGLYTKIAFLVLVHKMRF